MRRRRLRACQSPRNGFGGSGRAGRAGDVQPVQKGGRIGDMGEFARLSSGASLPLMRSVRIFGIGDELVDAPWPTATMAGAPENSSGACETMARHSALTASGRLALAQRDIGDDLVEQAGVGHVDLGPVERRRRMAFSRVAFSPVNAGLTTSENCPLRAMRADILAGRRHNR